jgi:hypothetical protein
MFPFFLKYLANAEYIIGSGLVASKFTLMMQILRTFSACGVIFDEGR